MRVLKTILKCLRSRMHLYGNDPLTIHDLIKIFEAILYEYCEETEKKKQERLERDDFDSGMESFPD